MNLTSPFDPWVSGRLCLTLMHSLWQVALVVALVYAIGRLWRNHSLECRYLLHVAALIAAVIAVPLTYSLIEIPTEQLPKTVEVATQPAAPLELPPASASGNNAATTQTVESNSVSSSNTTPTQQWSTRWLSIAPWLAGAYLIGVGLMTIRLTADVVSTERLRKTLRPIIKGPLAESLQRLSKKWHVVVMPMLAQTDHVLVPTVIGLLRPTILIPTIALTGMSAAELEMIIAHELAHIRRYDMWVNLLQRLAEVVLFFNPALWYLSRQIGTLREYCCDERACRMRNTDATSRLSYANALVKVVELAKPSLVSDRRLSALAASGRSPSELRRRVARLVGEPLREPLRLTWCAASPIALSVIMLVFGTHIWIARAEVVERAAMTTFTPATDTSDAKFTFGTQVNVLAIGSHAATPQRWWDTRGKLIPTVPFTWKESGIVSAQQKVWRRIVFRIDDLPKDADVTWDIVGAAASAGGEVLLDGGQKPKDYYTRYFSLPPDQNTFALRIGIANGLWQTVTNASGSLAAGFKDNKSILFSEALEVSEGTAVVVSHNYFGQSFRIIAIDKSNQQHSSTSQGGMSAGAIYQLRSTFPNVKPSDIDHFEFQVRDYEWIELKQLPSQPQVSDIGAATPGVDESSTETVPSAKSEMPWGWKQDGIQVRLRATRPTWKQGDDCEFKVEFRNTGTRELTTSGIASLALEVDGKAFPPLIWIGHGLIPILPFGPDKKYEFDIKLSDFGTDEKDAPKLSPGKHTITAILLDNSRFDNRLQAPTLSQSIDRNSQGALAVSNPVELEIESDSKPAKVGQEMPWGWKQDGIQVRLRATRPTWKQGEDCEFKVDFRNTGSRELTTSGIASLALEVDGKAFPPRIWNSHAIILRLPFGPDKKYEFDIKLSNFGTNEKDLPKLSPGKHTITAILLDNSVFDNRLQTPAHHASIDRNSQGALAVSNPVELEIESDSKPAKVGQEAAERKTVK